MKSCNSHSQLCLPLASLQPRCAMWAENGDCTSNKPYMEDECKKACKLCGDSSASAPRPEAVIGPATVELTKNLLELAKKLKPAGQASADPDSLKVRTASCHPAALHTGSILSSPSLSRKCCSP